MRKYKKIIALLILLGSVLLNACIGSQAPSNENSSNEDIIKQAHTEAAQTIEANTSLTEAAQPLPTNTQIILNIPTVLTPTAAFITSTPLPSSRTLNSSSPEYVDGIPCLRAEMAFETIEDGSIIAAGTAFEKIWKLRNTGGCGWKGDFSVIWVGGHNFAAQDVFYVRDLPGFSLKGVENGEILRINIIMQAPSDIGPYTSYWMLRDEYGNFFGWGSLGENAFWVEIVVK